MIRLFKFFNKKEREYIEKEPHNIISNFDDFTKVTSYIYQKSGIIGLDKRALTTSKLQQYARDKNVYTTADFLKTMQNSSDFYQDVINIATVNETFFLRELKELQWLVKHIEKSNRPLKILSIPSSSGEEIYSILLLLYENNIDTKDIFFNGYDINSYTISCAIRGEYNDYSLHKLDKSMKDKYFNKIEDKQYKISSTLQNNTNFQQKNIFDIEEGEEQYDIILSRNMFIYFDTKNCIKALDIIISLLKTDGIYIKGHADYIQPHPELHNIVFGIYEKKV